MTICPVLHTHTKKKKVNSTIVICYVAATFLKSPSNIDYL